ncbi:hypothetical protein [Lederbergia graminis]|uniref:Uncharacterized protein n=1 Tax=Lederbergia graminis TaxID=735518 RepID=A0ABW0LMH9_9BACI
MKAVTLVLVTCPVEGKRDEGGHDEVRLVHLKSTVKEVNNYFE